MNLRINMGLVLVGMSCAGGAFGQQVQSAPKDTVAKTEISTLARRPIIRPKKPKPITKELSAGLGLTTDGWTIVVNKGWVKTDDEKNRDKFYNTRFAQIEFSEHKHVKEIKGTNTALAVNGNDKPKPFIYGKINNFYSLKLGYGNRRMIAGKPEPGTVSIHWVYSGGLSIGLLKPYYIDAYVLQDNSTQYVLKSIKYEEKYKESFVQQQNIVGGSGWTKGLGEIKVVPGIQAKTGLHFDFAATAKTKLAIEVGVGGELYTKPIEIMASQKAYPYLVNAYVTLQFGKRY
jgi:hypothetical protein